MIRFTDLQEGVYDPNIFKAFFLAGGPGSCKSFVVRRTTGGLGMKVVNSDDIFEKLLDKEGLSKKMPESEKEPRDIVRARAKKLTAKKKENFIEGRLGLIIDGTGKDYDKISRQVRALEMLGYDAYMIFVNTSLETAQERNKMRKRTLPEKQVEHMWNEVQNNIGKFQRLFGAANMIIVDNNDAGEDVFSKVWKRCMLLVKKKVTNRIAKSWIANELAKKDRTK